jgi:hypothetical protein
MLLLFRIDVEENCMRIYKWVLGVLMVLVGAQLSYAQVALTISPTSGPPGTVVTVTNLTTIRLTCATPGYADRFVAGNSSIVYTIPASAPAGSQIAFTCSVSGTVIQVLYFDVISDLDSDGDTVPDSQEIDACRFEFGFPENGGCPDKDNDTLTTQYDRCPDVFGPRENNGCPTGTAVAGTAIPTVAGVTAAPPRPRTPLPTLPRDGRCVLATQGGDAVNVRAEPTRDAAVVGLIDPLQIYTVYASVENVSWYIMSHAGLEQSYGFVSAGVVRTGGDCSDIADGDATLATILFAEIMFRRSTLDSQVD